MGRIDGLHAKALAMRRDPEPTPLRNLLDWALVAAPLSLGLMVAVVLAAYG